MQKILKLPAVKACTSMSRTTIYERAAKGEFPRPIKLGARASGWIEAEVNEWLERQIANSRGAPPGESGERQARQPRSPSKREALP